MPLPGADMIRTLAQSFRSALQILIAQNSVPATNLQAYREFLRQLPAA